MVFYYGIVRGRNESDLPSKSNQSIRIMNPYLESLVFVSPASTGEKTLRATFGFDPKITLTLKPGCEHLADCVSGPMGPVNQQIWPQIKGGTPREIFTGFVGVPLKKLSFTPAQVCDSVEIIQSRCACRHYLFLMEVDGEFFVARVSVHGGGVLKVRVYEFSYHNDMIDSCKHRVVTPQLDVVTS